MGTLDILAGPRSSLSSLLLCNSSLCTISACFMKTQERFFAQCSADLPTTMFLEDQVFFTFILGIAIWHQHHFKGEHCNCIRILWGRWCHDMKASQLYPFIYTSVSQRFCKGCWNLKSYFILTTQSNSKELNWHPLSFPFWNCLEIPLLHYCEN